MYSGKKIRARADFESPNEEEIHLSSHSPNPLCCTHIDEQGPQFFILLYSEHYTPLANRFTH
jgi:hypothetical protein